MLNGALSPNYGRETTVLQAKMPARGRANGVFESFPEMVNFKHYGVRLATAFDMG
jgi:hypothetical protein